LTRPIAFVDSILPSNVLLRSFGMQKISTLLLLITCCPISSTTAFEYVPSRPRDVPTNITLDPGACYGITAHGFWTDWYVKTDAAGYENAMMKPFDHLKRVPHAKWFALVCCIGTPAHNPSTELCSVIGTSGNLSVPETAAPAQTAHCFANDAYEMYWNNYGALSVEFSKIDHSACSNGSHLPNNVP
jgi:hypothetical protein